ncbi:RHS repeat-associated core domain-containing protein [Actinokineospora sp. NPDC004072]
MRSAVRARSTRGVAWALGAVLAASLVQAATPPPAAAADPGPSVPLPDIASAAVAQEAMQGRAADEATGSALTGDQPAGVDLDGTGLPTATPLAPSAGWDVATHTGDFTWSYPLRVPPVPGGLQPELALSYSSSSVDGRTSATNNQPSWVGEGWELSAGFIERQYGGCADDTTGGTTPPKTGDLCWRSDNATASFGGRGGMLVRDDATGVWRARNDDGSVIERFTGTGNGDDNGERWLITTVDGTQYHFGSDPAAGSTWTVPVYGDDAGEPCHAATFAASRCDQAWRWNLDKVVDRNGNTIRYTYAPETNSYGANLADAAVPYTRGGTLARVDYGLREGIATPAARVVFTTADRCVPGSECVEAKPDNWPDVPWDGKCAAATCPDKHSATFWSTKRLASITTQVWNGTEHTPVDRWTLDHSFPDPGDGEKAALWLRSVTHTGLVGGALALPPVTFEGTALPNRVDSVEDGMAPLNRYRVTGIISESGGVTAITYGSQCRAGGPMPTAPETNGLRCFPVKWTRKNHQERTDHFHKYVVTTVIQTDRIAANPSQVTNYEYLDGAAWHWDTSEFTAEADKTWSEFRGFGRVRVRTGSAGDLSGPVTMTETRYYRGMDGDRLPSGTRSASVVDTEGGSRTDSEWLRGLSFETATFEREGPSDQADPPRVAKTITDPVWAGPTATRGPFTAYRVRQGTVRQYTALAAGGWRQTRTETRYDGRGLPDQVNDLGDTATDADDLCTTTEYVPGHRVANLPATVRTVSVRCGEPAEFPRHAVSAERHTYDDAGNRTKTEVAKEWTAAEPVYAVSSVVGYDVHGRVTASTDARGSTSTIAYTPATGGPVTKTVFTSPPTAALPGGLVTTRTLAPAWGVVVHVNDPNKRKTEAEYDPLGRRTAVWLPNRPRADHPNRPSLRMAYLIRADASSAVTTTRIGPNGTDVVSTTVYDGLLRPRQTQQPALGGGRLVTDSRYDSHGRLWKTTQPYYNSDPVDTALLSVADTAIPGHTRTLHDGAGRVTASVYFGGAHEKWRTTTTYGGDRVHVAPPAGGTATTTITDARGRTVELREHSSAAEFDATRYAYTPGGHLASVTDAAGNVWRFEHDLRGRKTKSTDPDTGVTTMTHDEGGLVTGVRDAAGNAVATTYDALGRKTGRYAGGPDGPKLATWTYDTASKGAGQLASATRWVGQTAYTRTVHGYNALYRPTQESVAIPAAQGQLEGTYTTYTSYDPDGSVSAVSYPAAGELPEETVNYDYTDLGQPTTTTGGYEGATFRYASATSYTRYGEPQRVQLGTGTKRAWLSYYYDDHTRRLERSIVDAEIPNPMLVDNHYTYDPAGNVTSLADLAPGQTDVQCFRTDHLRRTTEAWTPAASTWSAEAGCQADPASDALAGAAPYWHSYAYDRTGNRTTEVRRDPTGEVTRTFAYDVPGHAHAVAAVTTDAGATTYGYDAAGRTTERGGQELEWDVEGRLAEVTDAGATTTFLYDADGNRLLRKDPGGTTLYLPGQEVRVGPTGGPKATRYYAHAGRDIAVRVGRGPLTWLAGDHQGTARVAVDADTREVTRRRQLPFGGPRGAAAAWPGDRGFLGGTADASTGLTHLGAREYDPDLGRFTSVDPVMDLSTPQQLNGYAYSENNPVTYSDPSGMIKVNCPDGECRGGHYAPGQGPASTYNPPVDWGPPAPSGISGAGCGSRPCPVGGVDPSTVYKGCGARPCKVGSVDPHNIDFVPPKVHIPSGPQCQVSDGALMTGELLCDEPPAPANPNALCSGLFNCAWEVGWRGAMATNPITLIGQAAADLSGTNITPDYLTVDLGAVIPTSKRAGIAGAFGFTFSKHGQLTFNEPRAGVGTPSGGIRGNTGLTLSGRLGWLEDRGASADDVNGFLQGDASSVLVGVPLPAPVGLAGGATFADGNGQRAYEYGVNLPGGWGITGSKSHGKVMLPG